MKDNLYTGAEARDKLMAGVDKVANAVKRTLGASGSNGMLEAYEPPYTKITNDGISIAQAIHLADPVEQMGANLMKEIGQRSDRQGGDGTTTSITLAQAILHEGMKHIGEVSPIELKKSLEACVPIIEASIKAQTKLITVNEVGAVAAISAEDEKIGALIQEIYQKIGPDGILYPDVSKTFDDYYTIGTGVKIEGAGFASPYMADLNDQMQLVSVASYKNPSILVTKQKITGASELNDLFSTLYAKEIKELVIFCDDFEATLVADLVATRVKRGFKALLVKLPVLWKDEWFEDIAKMTGATVVDPVAGLSFKTLKLEHLGTCGNVVVDKHDTYLDGIKDISTYISELNFRADDEAKIRAARLNTKTARLYVGAASDSALSYKRLKVEDARNAAWQALHGGIVAGGGVSLLNSALQLPDTVGGKILKIALEAPMDQIIQNAGIKATAHAFINGTTGFNVKTGEIVEMFEAGIVDPANVVLNAVRNAISVASIVLTSETVVTLIKETAPQIP